VIEPMPQPSSLPELIELERIVDIGSPYLRREVLAEISTEGQRFPVSAIALGTNDPAAPAVGFFGGVHGLERIGSHVVLHYLRGLVMQLQWDTVLQRQLESLRMVFVPIVNPGGMWRGTRANPSGVDLMRNAPIEASEPALFMIGGQRLSANLPWYRGAPGAPMEEEAAAVCGIVERELLAREFSIALDFHSGFGLNDRIWFPYACTARPFAHLPEVHRLKQIFEQTHPHHRYVFEPQSRQYLAHGDLWDFLHQRAAQSERTFLPLTLEMGSWIWVKKNPRQLFSRHGIFNPQIEHRQQRVLRRHVAWMDFVARSACSYRAWLPDARARENERTQALALWYPQLSKAARTALPNTQ
jgi:hypothetical protein